PPPPPPQMETGKAEQITDNIPQEIIEEILCRLPVKSLSRFKIISTCQGKLKACSLSSLLTEPVTRAFSFDFFSMYSSNDMVIVGSCNGLICVLVDACRFFLLNPSTRESEELPDFFTGAMFPKNVVSIRGYGFGFDESSGDYKVCAVCYMMFVFGSNMTFPSTARMYSLKADSWGRNLFFKDVCIFGSAKFVSGKLHWISDFKTKSKWDDVCFDLKSETFGIVKQTSYENSDERRPKLEELIRKNRAKRTLINYSPRLGVLKGYLCVFSGYSPTIMFDVWIWNEYGVEDSNYVTPLFVLPCGEVLFTYESDFFIHNKKDNYITQQHTVDFDRDRHGKAEVYTESLVSLALDD
ncbi:hypothetical protein MIMGU_mgv1a021845mg, partial [Erythranthe guttata]